MVHHYKAYNHVEWYAAGLKDYGDFGDYVSFVNQSEYGDAQLEGVWFYADDENLVIYWGTFGNYNSPGSPHDTYAEVYDDAEEFTADVAEWEAKPEYLEDNDDE